MKFNVTNKVYHHLLIILVFTLSTLGLSTYRLPQRHIIRIIPIAGESALKLEVVFDEIPSGDVRYQLKIVADDSTKNILFNDIVEPSKILKTGNKLVFYVDDLHPQRWFPAHPYLYHLTFSIIQKGNITEEKNERLGFRSFKSKNGSLYLNGRPIFLRGIAINPPGRGIPSHIERSRKFAENYIKFMKSIHVNIIRIPDDETWYDVCDEQGMMVFGGNYSGSVNGKRPPKDYDKAVAWYENQKYAPIAHHPSLMIYAMTNEVAFRGSLMPKWKKFLTYAHAQLQKWDSTRAYIGNAGYGYGQSGDITDLHRYWGWYYASPFTFLHIRNKEDIIPFKKDHLEPITFTENTGNYTGPGGQYNLTPDHKNPGSQLNWTGHAPWELQEQLADRHQSYTVKQVTELFRRLRNVNPELSGVFPFTILFHNWNTIEKFIDMDPKLVTKQVKLSYQPILVSWESWTPNVYAGSVLKPVIHIVNDDVEFNDLENAKFVYQLQDKTKSAITSDTLALPPVKYYGTYQQTLAINIPPSLVIGNYQLVGKIIKGDSVISKNYYSLFIANQELARSATKPQRPILLYDPLGITKASLNSLAIPFKEITSFDDLSLPSLIIIGQNGADQGLKKEATHIKNFVTRGGRMVILNQDSLHLSNLNSILDDSIKNVTMNLDNPTYPPPPRPSRNAYNINPERPSHPVFSGIDRTQLRVWSDYTQWNESKDGFPAIYPVTDGFVVKHKDDLQSMAVLADYGPGLEGVALAETSQGKGSIILSGFDLVNRTGRDPVADRLFENILGYMGSKKPHTFYPLITSPIIWGDYASEKGLITGVNSGLLLNPKPRLVGSYQKIHLVITKEGHEFAGRRGGFNNRPGLQYIPYGRRPFGPYYLRGFGNIPKPEKDHDNIGSGTFWCRISEHKTNSKTMVWNPSKVELALKITINDGKEVRKIIKPGEKTTVQCPVHTTTVKMKFTGDRRLVLLQTSFE